MSLYGWVSTVVGILGAGVGGALVPAYVKYRKSVNRTIEPFLAFVTGPIKYRITKIVRSAAAANLQLRHYCEHRLAAPGLDLLVPCVPEPRTLPIEEVYIPSGLRRSSGDHLTHNDLAAGVLKRAQVVGEPGSGKSSLVKRVFRDSCAEGIRNPRHARLPVRVELKDLPPPPEGATGAEIGAWLYEQCRAEVAGVEGFDSAGLFDTYVSGPGTLLLLDGLDEVRRVHLEQVERGLVALSKLVAKKGPANVVLVTMRSQLYVQLGPSLFEEYAETVTIEPFSPAQVYNFLTRWPFRKGDRRAETARIMTYLAEHEMLGDMCTNPLILAMYVANHDRGIEVVPESRAEFYREVIRELIVYRRARQVGLGPGVTRLREQRETLLGEIALDHLLDPEQPTNSLSLADAVATTAKVLGLDSLEEAETVLGELSDETGLFTVERRRESIRFLHLTVCEYFAGLQCAEGGGAGRRLVEELLANDPSSEGRLTEVVAFACALESRGTRSALLDAWTPLLTPPTLLRCYVESRMYDHAGFAAALRGNVEKVLAAEVRDEAWLREVRLVTTALRDSERLAGVLDSTSDMTLADVVEQLFGDTEADTFAEIFPLYLREDAAGALHAARMLPAATFASLVRPIADAADEPAVLAHGLDEIARSTELAGLWRFILAEAALRHPSVAKELQEQKATDRQVAELSGVHRRHRWDRCWATKGTLYGYLLAVTASDTSGALDSWRRLKVLSNFTPRRRKTMDRWARAPIFFWLVPATSLVYSALLFAANNRNSELDTERLPSTALVAVLSLAILAIFYLPQKNADPRSGGSQRLLNLEPRLDISPVGLFAPPGLFRREGRRRGWLERLTAPAASRSDGYRAAMALMRDSDVDYGELERAPFSPAGVRIVVSAASYQRWMGSDADDSEDDEDS